MTVNLLSETSWKPPLSYERKESQKQLINENANVVDTLTVTNCDPIPEIYERLPPCQDLQTRTGG